jgi:hypothetical protein
LPRGRVCLASALGIHAHGHNDLAEFFTYAQKGKETVVLTRIDELVDRYSGCSETGGDLRERVEGLREKWRESSTPTP